MTTDIQKYDPKKEILLRDDVVLTKAEIKKHYAPGATDDELAVFVMTANAHKLDPVKREIHFVKYGNNPGKCVIGYQSYIKRAEETGRLGGYKVDYEGEPPRSTCKVTIHRKDWEVPFVWETSYNEVAFAGGKGDSKYLKSAGFKTQPIFMHKKTTICQAFRLAFPTELGGMPYEESELPHGEPIKAEFTVENGLPHIKTVDDDSDMPFRNDETQLSRLELYLQGAFAGRRKEGKEMLETVFGTHDWTKIEKMDKDALTVGYEKIKEMLDGVDQPADEESGSHKSEGEKPIKGNSLPPIVDPDSLNIADMFKNYMGRAELFGEDVMDAVQKAAYPWDKDPAKVQGNFDKKEWGVCMQKLQAWWTDKELGK